MLKESPTAFGSDYAESAARPLDYFRDRTRDDPENFIVGAFSYKILIPSPEIGISMKLICTTPGNNINTASGKHTLVNVIGGQYYLKFLDSLETNGSYVCLTTRTA